MARSETLSHEGDNYPSRRPNIYYKVLCAYSTSGFAEVCGSFQRHELSTEEYHGGCCFHPTMAFNYFK